jgi:hypothetical protein
MEGRAQIERCKRLICRGAISDMRRNCGLKKATTAFFDKLLWAERA